jgi:2-haloacid dehalogenase
MSVRLDVDAVVFDAYGTLFDVGSVARRHAARLGDDWAAFSALWRRKQLEYTWLRTLVGKYTDFWHVTGESLDYALAAHRIVDPGLRAALMEQYLALDPYPDAKPVLTALHAAHKKSVVLSNGTQSMLIAAISTARLAGLMESPLSVESVGAFKPHATVYQLAVDRLATPAARIAFVSGNGWDAWAATAFGFRTVWINRDEAPPERLPEPAPTMVLRNLAELPPLLGV